MKKIGRFCSWFFGVLFLLWTLVPLIQKEYVPAIPLFLISLLVLPPVRRYLHAKMKLSLHLLLRLLAIGLLLFAHLILLFISAASHESIFRTPAHQAQLFEMYDAKLAQWPVPYETRTQKTEYGSMHMIISGPEEAPPAVLLHASGLSAVSWADNIDALAPYYRTYAIDVLGDAGKSVLKKAEVIPADGAAVGDFYAALMDSLGLTQAEVIGASGGGFIATNLALHHPEKVNQLALLGPMGMTPATGKSILKIILVTLFPVKPVQEHMYQWSLGDSPKLENEWKEWFYLVMNGLVPKVAQPKTFTPEQLQTIEVPVLLVLGRNDNLTGDPEKVKLLAENVPNIRIEVLESGHFMGGEVPEIVNPLLQSFFAD